MAELKTSERFRLGNKRNLADYLYLVRFPLFNKNKSWSKRIPYIALEVFGQTDYALKMVRATKDQGTPSDVRIKSWSKKSTHDAIEEVWSQTLRKDCV